MFALRSVLGNFFDSPLYPRDAGNFVEVAIFANKRESVLAGKGSDPTIIGRNGRAGIF